MIVFSVSIFTILSVRKVIKTRYSEFNKIPSSDSTKFFIYITVKDEVSSHTNLVN